MSYLNTFQTNFLAPFQTKLGEFNPATATVNDLLMMGALHKMGQSVMADLTVPSALTLNLLEGMNGTQLQTWLGTASQMVTFQRLLSNTELMRAVAATPTLMAAIIGSALALAALLQSPSAMAIVAQSQPAMAALVASATAMEAVINSYTALAAIASVEFAWRLFMASTALTTASNPTMTGWSTPTGNTASTTYASGYEPYRMFDGNPNGGWLSSSGQNYGQTVTMYLPAAIFVHTVQLNNVGTSGFDTKDFGIQCSSDLVTWRTVAKGTLLQGGQETFKLISPGRFTYWRFHAVNNYGSATQIGLNEMKLLGFT